MQNITPAKLLATLILPFLTYQPQVILGRDLRDLDRQIDPVEVAGHDISPLIGAATNNIRVYASRNKKLLPIPFQIDQKNSEGDWVWAVVPEHRAKSIVSHEDNDSEFSQPQTRDLTTDDQDPLSKSVFDSNDILVFMARDTGDRHFNAISEPGSATVELKISDSQNGTNGWVYIVRYESTPPARANQQYVTYQENARRVVAPSYEFVYSAEHSVMLDDLTVSGVSILEQSRIAGKVKAGLGPLTKTMKFDERAIDGYDAGYINGPVRVIKRSIDHVEMGAGIRSPDVNCDHYYYPWHAEVPMLFSIRFPVKGVEILATSKYRSGIFHSARVPEMKESIGFGVDRSSSNLLEDRKDARWLGLYGDGLTVLTLIKIPENIGEYFSIEPYLVDNPGRAVEAGYFIQTRQNIVKGDHVLHSVYLVLEDSKGHDEASKAINLLNNKLHVEATALQ